MSDDFGTISARRAKELDVLRKHRESLVKMLADVDAQLRELGEITAPAVPPPVRGDDLDSRPLVPTPGYDDDSIAHTQPGSGARVLGILGAAVVALGLLAGVIWWASSDRGGDAASTTAVVEETTAPVTAETSATAPETVAEAPPAAASERALTITPRSHDYGLVRKGTRATRQYQFTNNSDDPVTITLARSACRCLFYEYEGLVPPKASETITVTVDGAKAKAGTLRESIRVAAKSDPSVGTTFDVIATVR